MSTQFEFIMQLYMMNLLQQQQQQQLVQQQQQQQLTQQQHILNIPSPRKREMDMDISSSTMAPTTNTNQQQTQLLQQQQQQQFQQLTSSASPSRPHNPRTLIRKNSHTTTNTTTTTTNTITTNCSSSSSCITRSLNSNSNSSIAIQQQQQQQQQLLPQQQQQTHLLNNTQQNLSPLQQLLLSQLTSQPPSMLASTTPPALTTPSNLLLTPTTPNSGLSAATALSLAAAAYNVTASSQYPIQTQIFPTTTNMTCNNITPPITTGNFLQSSTVTSTPTEEEDENTENEVEASASQLIEEVSSPIHEVSIASNGVEYICDTVSVEDEKYRAQAEDLTEKRADQRECAEVGEEKDEKDENDEKVATEGQQECDNLVEYVIDDDEDVEEDEEEEDEEEEDEKPLATLLQSTSVEGKLSARNSSNLSDASSSVPYQTPTKQPADSTHYMSQQTSTNTSQDTGSSFTQTMENENCNMTPMSLANTLLTPPSSDQVRSANSKNLSINPNMQTIKTESTHSATQSTASAIMSLGSVSSLDAFLQNEENLKNLHKVSSYLECENLLCRQENLREHFHCHDEPCQGKILSKKDDIIRHLKWHKKRKESLLLGFARFSASDDCQPTYGAGCAYCWKQTHYHCVYEDCPKVYVSTSDVQMHANFHRKNSEIVQEGFRRFRAHENCKIEDCPFFGKKTSHYHCCREGCNHTFKNKADMDKHKSYHLRDYQLTQDGFKKILKTETCPFEGCKFSTVCNHIHCVRESCNYILHSSSQMISHKRKHDRLDGENAYQNYKKQKDSSGEDSPATIAATATATSTTVTATTSFAQHTTTPLSSLSADRFLARKRGRPPKKIELPVPTDTKRIKLESNTEQSTIAVATAQLANNNGGQSSHLPAPAAATAGLFPPPFLSNFNAATAAAAAAAAQSMQMQDPNAPNVQLTHLMALFQLQNPLFYQNLYPGGMPTNMANMLGAAAAASAAAAGVMPPASGLYGNIPGYGGTAPSATIKSEFGDKQNQQQQPYKE